MRFLGFLIISITLLSCSAPTSPIYKEMTDVEVQDMSLNNVTLKSNLVYHNPNMVGATVVRSETHVTVNGIAVGKVDQIEQIEVPGKGDFKVPVSISFPPKEIFKSKGLLRSAIQILSNEKAKVEYKGTMTFSVAGVEFELPVDHSEEIDIKKAK